MPAVPGTKKQPGVQSRDCLLLAMPFLGRWKRSAPLANESQTVEAPKQEDIDKSWVTGNSDSGDTNLPTAGGGDELPTLKGESIVNQIGVTVLCLVGEENGTSMFATMSRRTQSKCERFRLGG